MSAASPRRHPLLRRLGRAAVAVTIGVVTLAAVLFAGVTTPPHAAAPVRSGVTASPATASEDDGRLVVAVVLGRTGTDPGDAFAPYEVFARSPRFDVYTVAADRSPAPLDGGLAVQPSFTFADIDGGAAPSPDVVVVPALNDPDGEAEAELREWIVRQERSGTRILGVCAGARVRSGVTAPPAIGSEDDGRLVVAVVLGRTGTDPGDAFAPYEVFARSPRFDVYTVAADRSPAPLDGGLAVQPSFTFADIDGGAAPSPDVVVVPALNDPDGEAEAELREWIVRQERSGTRILGVCAGARVLAAAGVLDGHRATSHWSWIGQLEQSAPAVDWVRGQRYVQDGRITTTAGVSSGIPGALRVLQDLAGDDEAERVGREMDYPSWSLDGPVEIPIQSFALADVPLGLNVALPWFRPTVGVLLSDAIGELDAVAAFEVNNYAYAATLVPVAEHDTITTEHGVVIYTTPTREVGGLDRLLAAGARSAEDVPRDTAEWATSRGLGVTPLRSTAGRGGFDAALEDLAAHADAATARATAKMIDYPIGRLSLAGGFDARAPLLLAVALLLATAAGLLPSAVRALRRRARRQRPAAVHA